MHISDIVNYVKNEINFSREFCEDNVFVTLRIEPILKILQNLEESHKNIISFQEDIIKKDKIIDLMANHIATSDSDLCQYLDITTKCKYYAGENKKTCDNCIKQYFERKIEQ